MAYTESEYVDGLNVAGTLDGSELVPLFQGGDTKQTSTQDIANLAQRANGVTQLIASSIGIDANTPATTTLTYEAGKSLVTHTVLFTIITYGSGDMDTTSVSLHTDAGGFLGIGLDSSFTTGIKFVSTSSANFSSSGNITCIVGSPSTNPGTFNVFVYGILNP